MRGIYAKPLRQLFAAELQTHVPHFQPGKVAAHLLLPGERCFNCLGRNQKLQWIFLVPSVKDDEFTIELGWSSANEFPQQASLSLPATPQQMSTLQEFRCRLGLLAGSTDIWWHIDKYMSTPAAKQLLAAMPGALQSDPATRVLVCVRASVSALVTHGIPFLNAAAA